MNKYFLNRISLTFSFLFIYLFSQAQSTSNKIAPSFESTMRSNDKIYVVMAVCLVILIILLTYLIRIDLKISKKEKNM
ncbi:MAG: CcmD family protein [Ginsengibacter sp.]